MIRKAETEKEYAIIEALAREIWTEHYTPIIGREQIDYMLNKFQPKGAIINQIKTSNTYTT